MIIIGLKWLKKIVDCACFPIYGKIGYFLYIKIQPDSEVQRTETKEMNKHAHSISFACALQASPPN